ncbi:MAG TPA: hypothetical protein VGB43_04515, partial [Flavobacterium sp.]
MEKKYIFRLLVMIFSMSALAQDNQWYVVPSISATMPIRDINILQNGELWLGTYNNGAKKLVNNNWVTYLAGQDVREIAKDASGNYWFATWDKLRKYTPATNTYQSFNVSGAFYDILYSIEIDDEDRIWVGTDGGADPEDGLYLFNTGAFFHSGNSV